MKRTTPISIEIGHQELLIAVTYRYVAGQSATWTEPGHPAEIDVLEAVFLLRDNARPPVPDCMLWAIQNDAREGGPIWDELVADAMSDTREYERS